jgi:hypothetical protein
MWISFGKALIFPIFGDKDTATGKDPVGKQVMSNNEAEK